MEDRQSDSNSSKKQYAGKKKEGETHMVQGYDSRYAHPQAPYETNVTGGYTDSVNQNIPQTQQKNPPRQGTNNGGNQGNGGQPNNRTRKTTFDPIPITYAELFPQLVQSHQVWFVQYL